MEDLIFISHRIPYPPNKGDKVRSWNALHRLAERYRVHLGTFIDDNVDWRYEPVIRDLCESYLLLPLNKFVGRLRSMRAFFTGKALTVPYFRDARLVSWLDRVRERYRPSKAFTYSSGVAAYVMGEKWKDVRRVHDMVDVDSDKWRQYAAGKHGISRWVYDREGRKLFAFEREIAAEYDVILFVSENEAEMFRRRSSIKTPKIRAMRNGVDTEYFNPKLNYDNPYPREVKPIVFTGTMDYWPNVDAAKWFSVNVLEKLLQKVPNATFYIVGANPTRDAIDLGKHPAVAVTGSVPDIRPYIAHARVIAAPLQIARGVQNKVLEGMAMAKPVIASPMALEGIDAEPGRDLLIAETPEEFVSAVAMVIEQGADDISKSARERVLFDYSWDKNFERLFEYLDSE
jgi:sugar transferase (PEP-CTERM/EpsH1 system associated)